MGNDIGPKIGIEGEKEFKKALDEINQKLKVHGSEMKLVASQYDKNDKSAESLTARNKVLAKDIETLTRKTSLLSGEYDKQNATLSKLEKNLEQTKKEFGEGSKEVAKAQAEYDRQTKKVSDLEIELNKANATLNKNERQFKENAETLKNIERGFDDAGNKVDEFGNIVKDAGDESEEFGDKSKEAINALAAALIAAGVTKTLKEIVGALKEATAAATDFGAGIAKISTIADASVLPVDELKTAIIELSNETGASVAELNEAVYQAISGGVDAAKSIQFVSTANKLAIGGFTDTTSAVDVLTTALNAYQLSADETAKVSDILVTTQNLGKTSVAQLSQEIGKVIPTAAAYNVELDNLAAAYAILTQNGLSTNIATTALNSMLSELGNSSSKSATILREQTGKSFSQLTKEGKSLGEVLEIVYQGVDNSSDAFAELFGETSRKGANSLLNTLDKYEPTLQAMQNSSGATALAFETMSETAAFAEQRFLTSTENFKVAIGDALLPALSELRMSGADAFEWATDLIRKHPWMVSAITALTVAIGVCTVAVTGFALVTKFQVIPALAALKTALLANPIFLAATAITALTTAMVTLAATTQRETTATEELRASTKELIKSIDERKKATEDALIAVEKDEKNIISLVSTLDDLMGRHEKTASDMEMIDAVVSQLNDSVDGLNLSFDREKNTLIDSQSTMGKSTESILKLAEARKKAAEKQIKIDEWVKVALEEKEITEQLAEAKKVLADAEQAYTDKKKDLLGIKGIFGRNELDDLLAARALVEELGGTLSDASEQAAKLSDELEGLERAANSTVDPIESMESAIKSLNEKYEAAKETVRKTLESIVGGWQAVPPVVAMSADEITANLQSQIDFMLNYRDNLDKLMSRQIPGVDMSAFIASVSDGSMESAQILAGVVNETDEKVAEVSQIFAKRGKEMDAFIDEVGAKQINLDERMAKMVTDTTKTISEDMDLSDEAKKAAYDTIDGYIKGIESNGGRLNTAMTKTARNAMSSFKKELGIASPSKVFKEYGKNTIEGAIIGVESMQDELVKTYTAMGEKLLVGLSIGMKNSSGKVMETSDDIARELAMRVSDIASIYATSSDISELEYRLWEMTDGKNVSSKEKDAKRIESLSKQAEAQKAKINSVTEAYAKMVALTGENSEESLRLQKQLLQEQIELNKLKDAIDDLNSSKDVVYDTDRISKMADQEFKLWSLQNQSASDSEKLAKQAELLALKYEMQGQNISDTEEALADMIEMYGANNIESVRLQEQLMKEKIAYMELKAQIDEVNRARGFVGGLNSAPSGYLQAASIWNDLNNTKINTDISGINNASSPDVGAMIAGAVNAIGTIQPQTIVVQNPLYIGEKEIARAITPAIRAYDASSPQVRSDKF